MFDGDLSTRLPRSLDKRERCVARALDGVDVWPQGKGEGSQTGEQIDAAIRAGNGFANGGHKRRFAILGGLQKCALGKRDRCSTQRHSNRSRFPAR